MESGIARFARSVWSVEGGVWSYFLSGKWNRSLSVEFLHPSNIFAPLFIIKRGKKLLAVIPLVYDFQRKTIIIEAPLLQP